MGTFSRIRYVISANVNALLEKAEDPEKLLRALIREMEDAGEDARLAVADLLAERQHLERVAERLELEVQEWQERAEKAVATDRDDLARAALKARSELAAGLESNRAEQHLLGERIAQLETDMQTLKGKLADAKRKLKEMQRTEAPGPAPARSAPKASPGERKIREAMHRFDRLQAQVERLEARVRSYEVGGTAPAVWASEAGEQADPAIEAELEALKARVSGQAPPAAESAESRKQSEATEA